MGNLFPFFKKKSWRLCNAYSQTLRLHSSDIFCFSVHLRILI
nr:photosystem II protein I [Hosta clausa var. geumgangensis]